MWDRGSVQQVTPSAPCMGTSATCRWGAARQSRTSQQKPHGVKAGGALGRSDEIAEDDEEARPRSSRPAPSSPALWEGQPARLCAGTRRGVPGSQGQDGRGGPGGKAATRVAFPDFAFPGVAPSHCSLESSRQKTVATSETANSSAHWLVLFSPAAPSAGGRHRVPSPPTHRTACDPPQTEPFISETSRCPSSQHLFPATFPGLGAPLGQAGSRMKCPPG